MCEQADRIYKVYKHTLPMDISKKENDMVYIGITSINPDNRWRNGLGYYNNKYFDKNMVGEKLVDLENNLKRPLKVSDITCENCGFSYQMVKKYFKNLTGAKKYLGLM